MKKLMVLGMAFCLLLCGCNATAGGFDSSDETDGTMREEETSRPSADEDPLDARIAYYEQLVTDLQEELLQVKSELYASRVEYEAILAELKAQQQPPNGDAQAPSSSDFQYTVTDGFAILTAYVGTEKEVEIPATLDGYTVLAIGDRAFLDNARITSVTLPKTVTLIGWFAFSGCVSLERIVIPATVEAISYGAFQNCPSRLTVVCDAGSYAAQYAVSYGIRVKTNS